MVIKHVKFTSKPQDPEYQSEIRYDGGGAIVGTSQASDVDGPGVEFERFEDLTRKLLAVAKAKSPADH